MCANVMGSQWWFRKKAYLQNIREDELKKLEKERRAEERRLVTSRNQQIRSEMGLAAYFSFKKANRAKRDYLER